MQRCLELARKGLGSTYPNPLVGSVIVHENRVIGEGWHHRAGEPHAEVLAIRSVGDKELLKQSTLYVNLEPCSHHGKTPPCADLIISYNIPEVVIGNLDPNPKVAGKGIEKLASNNIDVTTGILEKQGSELNKRFFTYHLKQRPYIFLKWAQSKDGFVAPIDQPDREPFWLSNRFSRQRAHRMRAEEQAILVGKNTVIKDDPGLSTRLWTGNSPLRLIIDRRGEIPAGSRVLDGSVQTLIFCEGNEESRHNISWIPLEFELSVPRQICRELYDRGIQSLIVEGGTVTLQHFIDDELWDEAYIFESTNELTNGLKAPKFDGKLLRTEAIEKDRLHIFKNPRT